MVCLPGSSWEKIPVLHMGLVTERSLPEIPEILDSQYVSDLTQTFVLHWCQTPVRFIWQSLGPDPGQSETGEVVHTA